LTTVTPNLHHGQEVDSPVGESDHEGHEHSSGGDTTDETGSGEQYDEDESDEEDEDEDDEEEDIEPSLKYERLLGDTPQLLEKDSACALAISDSAIVSAPKVH
jgi:vacuolar protein sorting-associated protein 41